jgi:hypothetical protein
MVGTLEDSADAGGPISNATDGADVGGPIFKSLDPLFGSSPMISKNGVGTSVEAGGFVGFGLG